MSGFWYLATVYSKHPKGQEEAYKMACRVAATLTKAGLPIFCPVAHTHGMSGHGGIDPLDHDIWVRIDKPMVDAACGVIVYMSAGWEQSRGIAHEVTQFEDAGKTVLWLSADECDKEEVL